METKENKFLNYIDEQNSMFNKIKEYINKYEKNITTLQVLRILGVEYYKFSKTCRIKFQDHREQFDFSFDLNKKQTGLLMLYINNPELFNNSEKYNL